MRVKSERHHLPGLSMFNFLRSQYSTRCLGFFAEFLTKQGLNSRVTTALLNKYSNPRGCRSPATVNGRTLYAISAIDNTFNPLAEELRVYSSAKEFQWKSGRNAPNERERRIKGERGEGILDLPGDPAGNTYDNA